MGKVLWFYVIYRISKCIGRTFGQVPLYNQSDMFVWRPGQIYLSQFSLVKLNLQNKWYILYIATHITIRVK